MTSAPVQLVIELDARLIKLAKPILVLKHLNWLDEMEEIFLKAWRAGSPVLPVAEFQLPNWSGEVAALEVRHAYASKD